MIKNIFRGFFAVALIIVVYQAHRVGSVQVSILDQTTEIKEIVVEVKEILIEPVIDLANTPWTLDNEYHCLASNIYWEARNQPLKGKIAVAQVTLNRVESSSYPDTICSVVTQTRYYPSGGIDLHSCQFSWYCDGLKDEPVETWGFSYEESFDLAVKFLQERPTDFTEGSTHYHNTKVNPFWTASLEEVIQIEEHIFYK